MGTYNITSAEMSGTVEFSDGQWAQIEATGKKPMRADLRKQVHDACLWYLLSYRMESNRVSDTDVRKTIEKVRSHSRSLMDLLSDHHEDEAHGLALKLVSDHHLPPRQSIDHLYDQTMNLCLAADRALTKLPMMTRPARRGPSHSESFKYLVYELGKSFEAAGGKVAKAHRSAFSDFVYQVLCCLPEHPHPQSPEAIGGSVRDVLRKGMG